MPNHNPPKTKRRTDTYLGRRSSESRPSPQKPPQKKQATGQPDTSIAELSKILSLAEDDQTLSFIKDFGIEDFELQPPPLLIYSQITPPFTSQQSAIPTTASQTFFSKTPPAPSSPFFQPSDQIPLGMIPPSHAGLSTTTTIQSTNGVQTQSSAELTTTSQTDITSSATPTSSTSNTSNSKGLWFNAKTKHQIKNAILLLECFLDIDNRNKLLCKTVAEKLGVKQLAMKFIQTFQVDKQVVMRFSALKTELIQLAPAAIESLISQLQTDLENPNWKPMQHAGDEKSLLLQKANITQEEYSTYQQNLTQVVAEACSCDASEVAEYVNNLLEKLIKITGPKNTIIPLISNYASAHKLLKDNTRESDSVTREKILTVVNHDGGGKSLESLIKHLQPYSFLDASKTIDQARFCDFMYSYINDIPVLQMTFQTPSKMKVSASVNMSDLELLPQYSVVQPLVEQICSINTHYQLPEITNISEAKKKLVEMFIDVYKQYNSCRLWSLGFTADNIVKMVSHKGGPKNLLAVTENFDALNKLGFNTAYILKMVSHDGGSKNLLAVTENFDALNKLGFIAGEILKMVSCGGGSKNLLAVTQNFKALLGLGFNAGDIIKMVSYGGGSKNLLAVTENFDALKALGFSAGDILKMVSHIGGSKNLLAVTENFDALKALGFSAGDILKMVSHIGGSKNLQALIDNILCATLATATLSTKELIITNRKERLSIITKLQEIGNEFSSVVSIELEHLLEGGAAIDSSTENNIQPGIEPGNSSQHFGFFPPQNRGAGGPPHTAGARPR